MEKNLYDRLNKPLVPGGVITIEPGHALMFLLVMLESLRSYIEECYPERYGEVEDLGDAIEVVKTYR